LPDATYVPSQLPWLRLQGLHSPLTARLELVALALDSVQPPVAFQRHLRRKAIKDCTLSAASDSNDAFDFAAAMLAFSGAVDTIRRALYNDVVLEHARTTSFVASSNAVA
jgi:hypothetical protein